MMNYQTHTSKTDKKKKNIKRKKKFLKLKRQTNPNKDQNKKEKKIKAIIYQNILSLGYNKTKLKKSHSDDKKKIFVVKN